MPGPSQTISGALSAEDDALIARFLDQLWLERGLSPNTQASYRSDLALFARWLGARNVTLAVAGEADIKDYLAARGRRPGASNAPGFKPRSQARLLSSLRALYRWLVADRQRTDDPTVRIAGPKLGTRLPKTLSEADVDKCLKDQALLDKIAADQKFANEKLKVNSTPTFFINGEMIKGETSFEEFDKRIKAILKS